MLVFRCQSTINNLRILFQIKYEIIEEHRSDNSTLILITKGTRVKVGERSTNEGSSPNWIYCYNLNGNGEGWTTAQIIQIESEYGIVVK